MSSEKLDLGALNKALEDKLLEKRKEFKTKVVEVIREINSIDLDRSKHVQVHMNMLILREDLVFEIAAYKSKLATVSSLYRKQKKEKYHHYTTSFDIKLNHYNDKEVFISADLTELLRQIDIMNNFIYFLKEQIMTCDKLGFSIKHIVESN